MADDNLQRPFRTTDPQSRATPRANGPSAGDNDPLTELARLIGQSDPFGEFGRESRSRPAAPQPADEHEPMLRALAAQAMPHDPSATQAHAAPGSGGAQAEYQALHEAGHGVGHGAEEFARQHYGGTPLTGGDDVYQIQGQGPGYDDHAGGVDHLGGHQDAGYDAALPPYGGDELAYYDDLPPPRRRMGVLAIAAVFALAVVGTAGAFGYRALFGSVGSGPPPVIKADSKPAKIVPDKGKDHAAKLITDRVTNADSGQKLVSREEQPVVLNKGKPAGVLTTDQTVASVDGTQMPALGSGVIGPDPKKIHTITIHPDQPATPGVGAAATPQSHVKMADATSAPPTVASNPATAMPAKPLAAAHETTSPPPAAHKPKPRHIVTHHPAPAPHRTARAAPARNAPLSLSPDAAAPSLVASAPARSASAPTRITPLSSHTSHGYAVQVSSRRSRADAQAALHRMQGRFASVVGGHQVMVRRVDLGAKGVYYRAMIGPFGNSAEASKLCRRLKAAGGSCFIQRI